MFAQRELYPETWKRGSCFIPVLMAAGVALTISNTRAVLEALFGVQTAFARTPKYAIQAEQGEARQREISQPQRLAAVHRRLAIGGYFLFMMEFAVETYQLPGDSVSSDLRRRLLLGGIRSPLAGFSGPAQVGKVPAVWNCNRLRRGASRKLGAPAFSFHSALLL